MAIHHSENVTDEVIYSTRQALDKFLAQAGWWPALTEIKPLYSAPPAPVDIDRLQEGAYKVGLTAGWNFGIERNSAGFDKCMTAHEYNACCNAMPKLSGNSEQLIKQPSNNQDSDSNASSDEIKQPASNSEYDKFYVTGGTFYPAQQLWPFIFRIGESQLKLNADGTASFEGDTDASARVFFDNVIKLLNHQYRDYERQMSELRHELDAVKLKDSVSDTNKLPPDEIECDICGFKSTDPDGAHYCCEDNSND